MSAFMQLMRTLILELRLELHTMIRCTYLNSVVGSSVVPRPLRLIGYRIAGVHVRVASIFPGLKIYGNPRNLTIGHRTFLNSEIYLEPVASIAIGSYCQFGPQVTVLTSHHDFCSNGTVSRSPRALPVRIGDRVWLGARSVILPGVCLGNDVAVAAGAVVSRDCIEPGLYAGVPASLVRRHEG